MHGVGHMYGTGCNMFLPELLGAQADRERLMEPKLAFVLVAMR